ncbi:F0F1 ATP synthase subunit A [Spiroplasma endosymbiont of Anurida maritima]|uniref:F0F1 ATP synthase subunit A n=1 Tax=Spiroplasma endosymbiont of Anurida maritima TaxID=2967972 RepID=UPI0036D366FD
MSILETKTTFFGLVPDPSAEGIGSWSFTMLMPQLITLLLTTFIIMMLSICYYKRVTKLKPHEAPTGLVLMAELIIKWVEQQVIDLMGVKYKKLTIYFLYILLYFGISNLMGIIGFPPIATSYTVPLSMAIVTFFGIYYFGFKYQKIGYLKRYINPLELLTQFVPVISLSFRIFGNILGGSIILALLGSLLGSIWANVPYIGSVDLLSAMIFPFLNLYFDIFSGLIQAYIFAILTIAYWSLELRPTKNDDERILKVTKHQKTEDISKISIESEVI